MQPVPSPTDRGGPQIVWGRLDHAATATGKESLPWRAVPGRKDPKGSAESCPDPRCSKPSRYRGPNRQEEGPPSSSTAESLKNHRCTNCNKRVRASQGLWTELPRSRLEPWGSDRRGYAATKAQS